MIRIINKRATGKTSQLMLLAKERNGVVVCTDPKIYERKAHDYGLVGIEFISYTDYLHDIVKGHHSKYFGRQIFIDELELFLDYISKGSIKGYTLSQED